MPSAILSCFYIQLQGNIGDKAPTYLKDLIGRLSTFSDEPRVAGLVGLVITMVMDMAYMSSRKSSGGKVKSAGSSSCQVKAVVKNYEVLFYECLFKEYVLILSSFSDDRKCISTSMIQEFNIVTRNYNFMLNLIPSTESVGAPGGDGGVPEALSNQPQ